MPSCRIELLIVAASLLASPVARAQVWGYCQSNADCGSPGSYCCKNYGGCDNYGYCEPRPLNCPLVVIPVCGCDGRTYINECDAAAHGMSIAHTGACAPLAVDYANSVKQYANQNRSLQVAPALTSGTTMVEPRMGGPTLLKVAFNKPIRGHDGLDATDVLVAINGTPGGSVTATSISGGTLSLTLQNIPDACRVRISFPGVERSDGGESTADVVTFAVLLGDTNGDGEVNVLDLVYTRNYLKDPAAPCSQDINFDGQIDIFDLINIRDNLGHQLPQ